jgi:hypothetical protein
MKYCIYVLQNGSAAASYPVVAALVNVKPPESVSGYWSTGVMIEDLKRFVNTPSRIGVWIEKRHFLAFATH